MPDGGTCADEKVLQLLGYLIQELEDGRVAQWRFHGDFFTEIKGFFNGRYVMGKKCLVYLVHMKMTVFFCSHIYQISLLRPH